MDGTSSIATPNHQLKTDVLVVGAGPTGLMAANQLQRFGIDFIIIDKKSEPTIESRAILVTARSLEIYQQMGISDQVVRNGKKIKVGNLYANGKRKASVELGELGKGLSEFSFMLAFEQSKNEELLANNLKENGSSIRWNHVFNEIHQKENTAEVVATHEGQQIKIACQYVIACDGASSPIRQQLGFSFRGGTYKHKFFVADAILDWSLQTDQLIISPGKKNFCAFLPMYGNNNYRIIGTLPKSYFNQEEISFDDIKDVVRETAGTEIQFKEVNWFSTYKLHHRGVKEFRKGNVFLAGDSAHIHSPAGGQGMNTGLQDAYNLAWKLALVIKREADPSLLETYNEERLPFAKWLLRFTDRAFNMMTSHNIFIKLFRQHVVFNIAGYVSKSPLTRHRFFRTISQIWYSYNKSSLAASKTNQKLKFKAGDRFPYIEGETIYEKLTAACFHLVCVGKPEKAIDQNTLQTFLPFDFEWVDLPITDSWRNLGVNDTLFILVRPDNYILMLADEIHSGQIEKLFPYFRKP